VNPAEQRVAALLNGLGSFKYEELFVLFGAVAAELRGAGVVLADCECGELVTSLDMAGVSLSLCWLDEELEPLWMAAADAPAYRRGVFEPHPDAPAGGSSSWTAAPPAAPAAESLSATAGSGSAGQQLLLERLRAVAQELQHRQEELGALDAVAGDGDHGLGMVRGLQGALTSAVSTVARGGSTAALLIEAGEAWSEQGGGTSGALWGGALVAAGEQLARAEAIDGEAIAAAVAAALGAVMALGKAAPGDKTMVDALQPFSDRLQAGLQAGESLELALHNGAAASLEAALATAALVPKLGRARPHGARSLGHPDPGAMSLAYCVRAATRPRD
jgi:dihydroxyacetone kinase